MWAIATGTESDPKMRQEPLTDKPLRPGKESDRMQRQDRTLRADRIHGPEGEGTRAGTFDLSSLINPNSWCDLYFPPIEIDWF